MVSVREKKAGTHEIRPARLSSRGSGAGSFDAPPVTLEQAKAALAAFRRHKGYAQPVKAMTEAIKAARG